MAIDLQQLVTLVHVAELGSLSKASERLHIVQPALSRQIRMLEEDLGTPLFERHGRGMALTAAGQEVLEHAVKVLADIEGLRRSVENGRGSFRGTVRIGMTPTVAEMATVPLLRVIRDEHPNLGLRLTSAFTGHLLDWLRRDELDLTISYDPPPSKSLIVQQIMVEQLYLVSASRPLSLDQQVEFSSLTDNQLILPSPAHGLRSCIAAAAASCGIEITTLIETDSFSTMVDLTKAGFGDTILPLGPLHQALQERTLFAAPLVNPTPERSLALSHPADRRITPAARHVGQVFRQVAADLVAKGLWVGRLS